MNLRQTILQGVADGLPLTGIYAGLGGAVPKIDFYREVLALIGDGDMPNPLICWCGMDCSRCKTFRATLSDDDALRREVQQHYADIGVAVTLDSLHCLGCRSDEMMQACAECPYMRCGKQKGVDRCDACDEYPCQSLKWYIETYLKPGEGKFTV